MGYFFSKLITPAYYNFKKQNRYNYYRQIQKSDKLSTDELYKIQWQKLKSLIAHCYENVPYYNKLFNKLDIHPFEIKTLEDYSKLPELNKDIIRDNPTELLDIRLTPEQITFSATGGSTGMPIKIYKSFNDLEYGFALRYRSNAWGGWNISDKSVWIVSDLKRIEDVLNTETSLKNTIGKWIRRKLILDTRNCKAENMHQWVKQINSYKPEHVYGYATLLTEFSKFIVENNIKINGIKGVFSTAEPLIERELIQQAFNATVFDQYGSSEIPCIAHECKHGKMHLNVDEVLTEFVPSKENPELKRIICTPLYIYGMPLLRYNIGDMAISTEEHCNCGLPYPVMELKIGRISDNFLSPTGKLISTTSFGWHLTHCTNEIKQFQFVQTEIDTIIVKLADNPKFRETNENEIKKLLYFMFDTDKINVKFEYYETILPEKNGKFRPAKSYLIEKQNTVNRN